MVTDAGLGKTRFERAEVDGLAEKAKRRRIGMRAFIGGARRVATGAGDLGNGLAASGALFLLGDFKVFRSRRRFGRSLARRLCWRAA